jgi:hypothetical protein
VEPIDVVNQTPVVMPTPGVDSVARAAGPNDHAENSDSVVLVTADNMVVAGSGVKRKSRSKNPFNNNKHLKLACGSEFYPVGEEYPADLLKINEDSQDLFQFTTEIDSSNRSPSYGKEVTVVTCVLFDDVAGNKKHYNLISIPLKHLRILCKQLGITSYGSFTKQECRKAIASILKYHNKLQECGIHPRTQIGLITSSICRAVNIVFSDTFIESFRSINSGKTRKDHETRNMPKDFWSDASLAYNEVTLEKVDDNDRVSEDCQIWMD